MIVRGPARVGDWLENVSSRRPGFDLSQLLGQRDKVSQSCWT